MKTIKVETFPGLRWLASKTTGSLVHLGCRAGAWIITLARVYPERRFVGIDWSGEHRRSLDQIIPTTAHAIGMAAKGYENVTILNGAPELVPYDTFQPIGFVLADYDYSYDGLRRSLEPILAVLSDFGCPDTILALRGYREASKEPPNDVKRYVAELEDKDTFAVEGGEMAFKIFNCSGELRGRLKEMAQI